MYYQVYKPGKSLAPFIKFYWELETITYPYSVVKRIIPFGCPELTFHYGDPILKRYMHSDWEPISEVVFNGQASKPFDICQTGTTRLTAVVFRPHAARLFFSIPMAQLTDCSTDARILWGKTTDEILSRIAAASSPLLRIALIESFLIGKLQDDKSFHVKRLGPSIRGLDQSGGQLRMDALSRAACLSTKQLDREYADIIGLLPKQFSRIVRFQAALYHKQTQPTASMTELAYQSGYFDPAHFTKECASLTGFSPRAFFSRCLPFSDYFSMN